MARDRPGHFNEDMSGLQAFRDALKPQEGQFMRGATYIMNPPKDLAWKPGSRRDTDNEKVAGALHKLTSKGK